MVEGRHPRGFRRNWLRRVVVNATSAVFERPVSALTYPEFRTGTVLNLAMPGHLGMVRTLARSLAWSARKCIAHGTSKG